MEQITTFMAAHKLIMAAAVIISILIIVSVVKKFLKAAAVLLAIVVLYAAYLVYSGQKVPKTKQEVIEHSGKKLLELKKSGVKALRGVK